jgi:hypothetical protein
MTKKQSTAKGGMSKRRLDSYADALATLIEDERTPEVLRSTLEEFCSELSNRFSEPGACICNPGAVREHMGAILESAERAGVICSSGGVMFTATEGRAA